MSLKDPEELGHWKRPQDQHEFRALVDELAREQWTDPPRSVEVSTSFGRAVVHQVGEGSGTPAVLLPGFGAPALMYRPELVRALGRRPIHLVETIGDVGPSTHTAPIRDADDEAAWLLEVLDGLEVPAAHVVGTSFGAWLAFNLARHEPGRVRSVAGVEPVWHRIGARAVVRGLPTMALALAPRPVRERAATRYHQPLLADPRLRRVGRLAYTRFVNGHPRPAFLTDDELAGIGPPVLVLLAARSEVSDPRAVRRRLERVLPEAAVEVVPDAGHSLAVEHPERVGARIGDFLCSVDGDGDGDG